MPRRLPAAIWPPITLWYWNVFGVFPVDSRYNKWQALYSALLMVSCAYNIYNTPKTVCVVEGLCDTSLSTTVKGLFMRVVAITSLISRLVILAKGNGHLTAYNENLDRFHALAPPPPPTPPRECPERELLTKTWRRLVACLLLLTVPANLLRLYQLRNGDPTTPYTPYTTVSFILMYVQNFCMYWVETHFVALCFVLYRKLVGINMELTALKIDTARRNEYPVAEPEAAEAEASRTVQGRPRYENDDDDDADYFDVEVLRSLADGRPMIDFLERLKLKHRIIRKAVNNLNDLFGVHLGLSLCSLCLYTIFDLYYYMMSKNSERFKVLIYAWIVQYAVRFGSVTILGYLTTQQVLNSKILISDIDNRFLDKNTREELRLFHNQLRSCAIEITACDFFTINSRLITSAIATAMTYLVILLQFK